MKMSTMGSKAERRDWGVATIMNKAFVKGMTEALRFVRIAWRKQSCVAASHPQNFKTDCLRRRGTPPRATKCTATPSD